MRRGKRNGTEGQFTRISRYRRVGLVNASPSLRVSKGPIYTLARPQRGAADEVMACAHDRGQQCR